MNTKSIGILLMVLLFTAASIGCAAEPAPEAQPVEITITPQPVEATPEPTPTPLPPRTQPGEDVAMLQAALAELDIEIADLEKNYTTEELIALVVKLLGGEEAAVKNSYQHPYSGVSPEFAPHVGYAYATWLLTGVPADEFKPKEEADDTLLIAMLLRVLGYKDYGEDADFTPESMFELAKEVGIAQEDSPYPVRGDDVAAMLWAALSSNVKGDDDTLLEKLKDDDVFSSRAVRRALKVAIGEDPDYREPSSSSSKHDDEPNAASTESSSGSSGSGNSGGSSSGGGSSGGSSSDGGNSGGSNSGGSSSGGGSGGSSSDGGNSGGGDSGGGNSGGGGGAGGENETPSVPFE